MVISSLVVETTPDSLDAVADALSAIDGVEVHEKLPATPGQGDPERAVGKAVVTIERDTVELSQSTANLFVTIDGVIGIDLIYANFEDDPEIAALRARHRDREDPAGPREGDDA